MEVELKHLDGASIVTEATETKKHGGSADGKATVFSREAQPKHGSKGSLAMSEETSSLEHHHKPSPLHGKLKSVEVDAQIHHSKPHVTPLGEEVRWGSDAGRETPQSAANTLSTEAGREYETEDTSSGKVRPQSVKQKGTPAVEETVNTNGGKLSNE